MDRTEITTREQLFRHCNGLRTDISEFPQEVVEKYITILRTLKNLRQFHYITVHDYMREYGLINRKGMAIVFRGMKTECKTRDYALTPKPKYQTDFLDTHNLIHGYEPRYQATQKPAGVPFLVEGMYMNVAGYDQCNKTYILEVASLDKYTGACVG